MTMLCTFCTLNIYSTTGNQEELTDILSTGIFHHHWHQHRRQQSQSPSSTVQFLFFHILCSPVTHDTNSLMVTAWNWTKHWEENQTSSAELASIICANSMWVLVVTRKSTAYMHHERRIHTLLLKLQRLDKIPELENGESDTRITKLMPRPSRNLLQKQMPPLLLQGHS